MTVGPKQNRVKKKKSMSEKLLLKKNFFFLSELCGKKKNEMKTKKSWHKKLLQTKGRTKKKQGLLPALSLIQYVYVSFFLRVHELYF
jgi:hypothetical protein